MPNSIKVQTYLDREGDRVWIQNKTGAYVSETNDGGFGGINNALSTVCLLALAKRNASDGDQALTPVGNQFVYNAGALDTDEPIFEFEYKADGYHSLYLAMLPVSSDKAIDLNGNAITAGDHFYYTVDNEIHLSDGVGSTVVEDLLTVLDQSNLVITNCEDIFLVNLSIYRGRRYLDYKKNRDGLCSPLEDFNEVRAITEDIISANNTFASGLKIQSQTDVEILLDEYNL